MPRAITIGNFDGVHAGHRALLRRARELATPEGEVVAIAFDPHPLTRVRPEQAPHPIEPWSTREGRLLDAGADRVVRLEPTPERLGMSPASFVDWLARIYEPSFVIEGTDFRFGHRRSGDTAELARLCEPIGIGVTIVPPVVVCLRDQSEVVASSSIVRWLLEQGRVRDAAFVLGRPHELIGTVVPGDRIGRTIGFPTANLCTDSMPPAPGVYAAVALADGCPPTPAAVHIGGRPTVDDAQPRIEAHLIDIDAGSWTPPTELPESGWRCTLRLVGRVRDVMKLSGLPALQSQIARDCERARSMTINLVRAREHATENA